MIRRATVDDAAHIAPLLSTIERDECKAMGVTPLTGLQLSVQASGDRAHCITLDSGEPWMLFGCAPSVEWGLAHPWMIGGPRKPVIRHIARDIPRFVDEFQADFPVMENFCHRDNVASRQWLERLGFVFDPEPLDFRGIPMVRFRRCASL